jgi:hypothetical protein
VSRGYYLLDATGGGVFDFEADRFSLPVCGFAVQGGRSSAPVGGAWLCGGIGALLRGVQGVARGTSLSSRSTACWARRRSW